MGLSEGRRGLGAAAPLGTLLFRQVDSAIWVTRAESWGWVQRKEAGVAHRLFFFFSPNPRRKDWDLGTLGTSRIVSKAGPGGGAEVSAEQQGGGWPARAPGLPGGPRTLEARRWVSYLSIAVHI